ncbi:MAG TPA: twin-arginine translocation signal domain-containing protein, partial [Candidatus Acidoferrum sp.]|nr:twin-arginine translocation signal domain-containing protein [Candidatus Acidoferrum sp.]
MSNQNSSSSNISGQNSQSENPFDRRTFIQGAAAAGILGAAALSLPNLTRSVLASDDLDSIRKEIEKRHEESVHRLQEWIRQPSIAAENRGMNEGCEMTMRFLRDAGFQQVIKVPTD